MNSTKKRLIETGKNNEITLLNYLAKFKYTTPVYVEKLLNISKRGNFGFLERMGKKELIISHKFDNGLCKKRIIGITWNGLVQISGYLESKATNEKEILHAEKIKSHAKQFSIAHFKETQFRHHMATQSIFLHIKKSKEDAQTLLGKDVNEVINIYTTSEIKQNQKLKTKVKRKKLAKKYPDMLAEITLKNGKTEKIALEIELTPKSLNRYKEIIKSHQESFGYNVYDRVKYFIPEKLRSIKKNIMNYAKEFSHDSKFSFVHIRNHYFE